jgi:hypothetical protein
MLISATGGSSRRRRRHVDAILVGVQRRWQALRALVIAL